MSSYSGIIAMIGPAVICSFIILFIVKGYILHRTIKKDPVYTKAKIVSYFPKAPNEKGRVDIVMTYSFLADNVSYTKKQQTLNINTLDLNKYHIGKEVPIVYYRKDPNYSKIDVYDESLRN
ncbi:hypothetical protein [Kosakonia sp. SMBL-WEM22]|uniref:hypothetical protein n=1 Tax=Kosakonia sp. SMBL-WEM22 TaxID=2725560 RepID=UPI001CB94809|nr:hypothetical protein [Kosakonia sp. SMBL-WEM22]